MAITWRRDGVNDIEFTKRNADLKMLLNLDGQIYKEKMRKSFQRLTWLRIYKINRLNFLQKKETGG